MAEGKKPGVATAMKYFGKKNGQNLKGFSEEWNALTDQDKDQLVNGIVDGSLDY